MTIDVSAGQESAVIETQLDELPAALELPTDRPRPAILGAGVGRFSSTVHGDPVSGLRALADESSATPLMTVLAATGVLLHRYSEQDDIVVGTPVEAHGHNLAVVRCDLSGTPSFRELLARVRRRTQDALDRREIQFERLVESFGQERDLSRHPVCQVVVALDADAAPVRTSPAETVGPPLDLSLRLSERPARREAVWEYSTDLFDAETIERMAAQFARLLEVVVADPDRPIDDLGLLSDSERSELLARWGKATGPFPVACLDELFEAQVARVADAIAVRCDGDALTYGELNERANRLARHLRDLGVGPDSLVALCLERSLELVVAIVAVLKAGGAYVPLDPDYPAERLAFVLGDCQAPVLLTQEKLVAGLPAHEAKVVLIDRDQASWHERSAANLERVSGPENLAYVIYTSGSTGRPKGVLVEHRNVARLFSATDGWFGPGELDTWTLFHSYAFDFSVWELWGALLHGGRLVVVPQWITRTPQALAELLIEEGVTVLNATPSLFFAVMDALLQRAGDLSLRLVVFGGEALTPRLLRPWFERFADGRPELVNMYGITETTVHVTYRPMVAADAEKDASPIGRPIPDLQLYLLDAKLAPVAPGLTGELFVGGAGVARGYLNRPELTAERFLENPFCPGRLYRTGDRARWRPNEGFRYEGRIDDQVKVRGFRIELGEIEAAILGHENVTKCVVVVRGQGAEAELAAYMVPRGAAVGSAELREFLARTLPAHMVPSTVTTLDDFPLTPNGKLDRKALPEPKHERSDGRVLVAPRTVVERRLVDIWEQELGIHPVGVADNFFDLGVTSIVAAKLFATIDREFGDRLPLSAVYRAPTVEMLAGLLENGGQESRWTSLVPIKPEGSQPPIFCVHAGPGDVLYFAPLARRLGANQPLYGLQARGLYGDFPPLRSVEEMASHYLSEMRQVCPHGPWRLAGLCLGGLIAYEMAQRVMAEGEEVELLALFNAPSPRWVKQWGWYGYQPTQLCKRPTIAPPTRTQRLGRALREPRRFGTALVYNYRQIVEPRRARLAHALGRGIPEAARPDYFFQIAVEAQRSYEAKPYTGDLLLLYGRGLYEDPELGWSGLAEGGITSCAVPGDHDTARQMLYEPAVSFVSERITEHLERAEMCR